MSMRTGSCSQAGNVAFLNRFLAVRPALQLVRWQILVGVASRMNTLVEVP